MTYREVLPLHKPKLLGHLDCWLEEGSPFGAYATRETVVQVGTARQRSKSLSAVAFLRHNTGLGAMVTHEHGVTHADPLLSLHYAEAKASLKEAIHSTPRATEKVSLCQLTVNAPDVVAFRYPRPPVAMPLSVERFVEVEHISNGILDTIFPKHLINEGFPLIREGVDEQIPARRGTRWDDLSEKVFFDSLVKGVAICLSGDVVTYTPMNEHRRGIMDVIDTYPTLRGRELVIPLDEGVDERSAAFDVLEDRSYLVEIPPY